MADTPEDSVAARLALRRKYEQSRSGTLTTYAALVGNQFAFKVDLLAQLLRGAHDPSLGHYKERLVARLLRDSLPSRYAVGTGFVLFPAAKKFAEMALASFDSLNKGDHEISLQCDIIIYDQERYPLVFRDDDFVVVLPEAVRAVIEVKGSLDPDAVDAFINHFIDFGRKWHRCHSFYVGHHLAGLRNPGLFVLAWQISIDPKGFPRVTVKWCRERVAKRYCEGVTPDELQAFPYLTSAFIYNHAEISSSLSWPGQHPSPDNLELGFWSGSGKLMRYGANNQLEEAGDGTIANLIAGVHAKLETPFNRFVSYRGEARPPEDPSSDNFTVWLRGRTIQRVNQQE